MRPRLHAFGSFACALFVLVALMLVSLPVAADSAPSQCPALQLDNPNPGDGIFPGGYVVSGIAFDPSATVGSGIAHVDFFLGSRDDGGLYLGSVTPIAAPGGPARFQTQVTIPRVTTASTEFVVYAFESTSSGTTSVAIPVRIGDVPPPHVAPDASPVVRVTSNCAAVATAVSLAPPLPAEIAFTATPGPQLAGPPSAGSGAPLLEATGPVLQLSNPSEGDLLPLGGYRVSGIAYDPGSSSGPGVDRIQFFLDPRENGGWLLGTAVPLATTPGQAPAFSAVITIPNSAPKGPHIFAAYAHSSVLGDEAIIQIPVFVGAKPTPTPLPT